MKRNKSDSWFFVVISVMAMMFVMMVVEKSFGQDVYNFYFQKAPGPQKIIQGGEPPKEEKAKTPENGTSSEGTSLKTLATIENLKTPPTSNWVFGLGVAGINDAYQWGWQVYDGYGAARRYAMVGKYEINKYFAVDGALAFALPDDSFKRATGASWSESLLPSAGITVTPIHIELFGFEALRIGFMGGMMWANIRGRSYDYQSGGYQPTSPERRFRGYLGNLLSVSLGPKVSIELANRVASFWDSANTEFLSTASINYKF